MRTTLLGSLLDSAARNAARGAERLALYELGSVYLDAPPPTAGGPLAGDFPGERPAPVTEPLRIGALASGELTPRSWRTPAQPADFFALKGVAEALAGQLGVALEFAPTEEPFLHPGRAAAVSVGGAPAGWLGELHPLVCPRLGARRRRGRLRTRRGAALRRRDAGEEAYEDVTTFPAATRDLAVVVPIEVPAARVRATVLEAGGELLRSAEVFDLYEGEQLGEGRKSLALALELAGAGPDPDRRGGRRRRATRSSPPWPRSEGRCVNEPADTAAARRRARGAGPGRRRQRLHRRPGGEDRLGPPEPRAGPGDLALGRRQADRPALPALPGAGRADRARPRRPASSTASTPRSSPTRTARRRRPSPRCAPPASSSSTSPPTSGCATWRPTSAGTASTAPPTSSAPASTGSARCTGRSCARRSWSPPPAATRPRPCSGWRRWPNRACSPTSPSPRCRAPRATAARATTSSTSAR